MDVGPPLLLTEVRGADEQLHVLTDTGQGTSVQDNLVVFTDAELALNTVLTIVRHRDLSIKVPCYY